jgi:hypothetical protein
LARLYFSTTLAPVLPLPQSPMSQFFINGVLSQVEIDASLVSSVFLSDHGQYPLRVVITGPDSNGNVFSTRLSIQPSTQQLSASYVLGQDWIQLARINAACE